MRLIKFNPYVFIYLCDARWKNNLLQPIRAAIKVYGLKRKGITIKLSNDKEIKKFNFKWRGQNKATNILSFPNINNKNDIHPKTNYMGDIIISYDTLRVESSKRKISFCNHMIHILLHGILHLDGFLHNEKVEELTMQKQEIKYLKKLNICNPYIERVKKSQFV